MINLINDYMMQPTLKNAQRLRTYERKHPMARVMLTVEEGNILADAIHHANKGA
jgi:hypothetical protein